MSDRFRILSLDGGGARGAFSASFLTELERRSGKRLLDHFDLITGTSTGGLLALGIALGQPPSRILEFYENEGPAIFPGGFVTRWSRWARHWFMAKHDTAVLRQTLQRLFGKAATLAEAQTRLVIPAFDVDRGRPVCFKTHHHESLDTDHRRPAWEVGLATASAPTYFPPYRASWGTRYVDGGIWANRPAIVGIIEAHRYLRVPIDGIEVLSVGTTGAGYRLGNLLGSGKLPWAVLGKPVDMLMHASEWAATFQSKLLLGNKCVEVNIETASSIPMDDARYIPELRGLGEQAAKERSDSVIAQFLDCPRQSQPSDLLMQTVAGRNGGSGATAAIPCGAASRR